MICVFNARESMRDRVKTLPSRAWSHPTPFPSNSPYRQDPGHTVFSSHWGRDQTPVSHVRSGFLSAARNAVHGQPYLCDFIAWLVLLRSHPSVYGSLLTPPRLLSDAMVSKALYPHSRIKSPVHSAFLLPCFILLCSWSMFSGFFPC